MCDIQNIVGKKEARGQVLWHCSLSYIESKARLTFGIQLVLPAYRGELNCQRGRRHLCPENPFFSWPFPVQISGLALS